MGKVTVACVWVGEKYGPEYVVRLRNMVERWKGSWDVSYLCYTDRQDLPEGWTPAFLGSLPSEMREGWWAKMAVFNPLEELRSQQTVYFDLDTVIVGPLDPLFALHVTFGICANFTRAVTPDYPCAYGSCVMTLQPGFGDGLWATWCAKTKSVKSQAGPYGDQWAIGKFYPRAVILQERMRPGFFVGRRDFTSSVPAEASVMVFAGKTKPDNTTHAWVTENWK